MLVSQRRIGVDDATPDLALARALHPSFCMRVLATGDITVDEAVTVRALGRGVRSARSRLFVLLEGRGVARIHGEAGSRSFELRPGTFVSLPEVRSATFRLEARARVLEIDWDAGSLARAPSHADVVHERGSLVGALELLRPHRPAATIVRETLARLSVHGAPFDTSNIDFEDEPGRRFQELCAALDTTLSALRRGPALVDMETALGVSRRTLLRRIGDYNARFGLEGVGGLDWRATRDYWRMVAGATLVTHLTATTEGIARALGYGSGQALCHAFAHAGLPAPGELRQAVAVAS